MTLQSGSEQQHIYHFWRMAGRNGLFFSRRSGGFGCTWTYELCIQTTIGLTSHTMGRAFHKLRGKAIHSWESWAAKGKIIINSTY